MKIKILQPINLTYTGKQVLHEKGEIIDIDKKVVEKLSLIKKYKNRPDYIQIIEDEIIEDEIIEDEIIEDEIIEDEIIKLRETDNNDDGNDTGYFKMIAKMKSRQQKKHQTIK